MSDVVKIKATPVSKGGTDGRASYEIREDSAGRMTCSCPDFRYRRSADGTDCKHIAAHRVGKKPWEIERPSMKKVSAGILKAALDASVGAKISKGFTAASGTSGIQQGIQNVKNFFGGGGGVQTSTPPRVQMSAGTTNR